MFGAGGGTSSYREAEETDLIVLWGSNARETHPIFFHHLLRGVRNGARLYAVDPRRTSSAEWADVWLGLDVGSDIALANAIGREIIHAGPREQGVHRPRHRGLRGLPGEGRAVHARVRRARDGRPGRRDPRDRPRLRDGRQGDDLLDARHHRAPQRRRQRPRADQPRAPDRPRRPVGQRPEPAARPEQRPGRRRHGRPAGPAAGLPVRRERRAAREVRRRLGRAVPPKRGWHLSNMLEAMDRRELTALYVSARTRCSRRPTAAGQAAPGRPRLPGRPGHLPDRDRRDRGRRAAGRRVVGGVRGHGHELRAARPAGPQGDGPAGRGARGPLDHLRDRAADGLRLGRGPPRTPGTRCAPSRRSTPA